jgi:hypothetical protein
VITGKLVLRKVRQRADILVFLELLIRVLRRRIEADPERARLNQTEQNLQSNEDRSMPAAALFLGEQIEYQIEVDCQGIVESATRL